MSRYDHHDDKWQAKVEVPAYVDTVVYRVVHQHVYGEHEARERGVGQALFSDD